MFSNAKVFTLFLALSLISNVMGLSLSGFGLGLASGSELINRNIVASTAEKAEEVFQVKPRKRSILFGNSSSEITAKHRAVEKRKKGGKKGNSNASSKSSGSADFTSGSSSSSGGKAKHGGHGSNGNGNGSSSSSSGSSSSSQTTTTTSAKPSATSSSSSGSSSQTFSGKGTWYTQDGVAGACGTVHSDQDLIVAQQTEVYGDGSNCGRSVVVTNTANGKSVTATVADECPGCPSVDSLDMSVAAFEAIGDLDTGVLEIQWYYSS